MGYLLLELFCEEIPARMQRKAAGDLAKLVSDGLKEAGLNFAQAKEYFTPRRLTLHLTGLDAKSADISEERKGPRTDAPQKAIAGFLRGAGLESVEQAQVRNDPKKGDFYVAIIEKKGRAAEDVIGELVPSIIRNFPWPKSQRWGTGSLRWVRPLRSILCVFDGQIVNFDVDGIASSNMTYAHRFHAPAPIQANDFASYAAALESGKVVLDAQKRKEMIFAHAEELAAQKGLSLVEDEALLEEVSGLVEWPVTLMGEFDEAFLDIPDEAIRLTIKENQKCFVLKKGDSLSNHFILVSNVQAADDGAEIIRGNQKVVNARLSDAKFFWETDLGIKLDDLLPKLDNVTFHAKLGSQGQRVQRIIELAKYLAPIVGADEAKVERAAKLAKADLNTNMVYEFPELQGMMGRIYASKASEDASVALAIEEHYKPQGPSDDVPSDRVSVSVALADKLDLLTGFWAIGEKPTGSKDPYALRRAALGVIRLVVENELRLPLSAAIFDNWLDHSAHLSDDTQNASIEFSFGEQLGSFKIDLERSGGKLTNRNSLIDKFTSYIKGEGSDEPANVPIISDLMSFFHDRLTVWLKDQGARDDVVKAVLATQGANDDLLMVKARVEALGSFLSQSDAENLTQGLKRGANILAAEEKKGAQIAANVNASLFEQDEEKALGAAVEATAKKLAELSENEDFAGAFKALAELRAPVDAFFEGVMVNADNVSLKANRLALLAQLRDTAAKIADFSLIQSK